MAAGTDGISGAKTTGRVGGPPSVAASTEGSGRNLGRHEHGAGRGNALRGRGYEGPREASRAVTGR